MPKVFCVEKVRVDVTKAKAFGDLTYIFSEHDHNRGNLFDITEFIREIGTRLVEMKFDPQLDIICIVGRIIPVALFQTAVLFSLGDYRGDLKLLLWNAVEAEYVIRPIRIKEIVKNGIITS